MPDRRNVILIGMDDAFSFWRFKTVFGAALQTPNLDRICEVSSAFTAAFCQIPVCGPSRASAMSGLSPYETGVFDNYTNIFDVLRPEQMWQFRLKQDGYYCTTAGKIHHGFKPLPPEVHDVLYSHPSRHVFFGPKRDAPFERFGGLMGGVGTTEPKDDRKYYDYRSSQDAIRFLVRYDGEAPFYREVGFHHPHPPFRTPIRFKEQYDIDEFIRPDTWEQGFDLSEFTSEFMAENLTPDEAVENWQKSIRNYFSAYSHVDHHIGRVWDALKASPHAENTIVVIFSDHGYHMGDKNRFRKFTLWEEATRVPFIIHDPQAQGRMVNDPVALVDMGPTILDYANARPMQHSVGRSLRPIIEGGAYYERAVPTFWYGSASVRKGDHRITLYQDGSSEFHNVVDDPWLTRNQAHKVPEYEPIRRELIKTCKDYGVLIVEDDAPVREASHYISVLQGATGTNSLPTDGVVSIGDTPFQNDGPGYRKHFATLAKNGTLHISDGIKELLFAADGSGGITNFSVQCNDAGNRIQFLGGHAHFTLEVVGGAGGDEILVSHDQLIAHLGPGDNTVRSGVSDAKIYGGPGRDTIHGVNGNNLIHGGSGNAMIYGGLGNDTIYTGSGVNVVETGPGENRVIVDGGQNRIILGENSNTLVFERTGLPQIVENFLNGDIDLTDWAPLGPVSLVENEDEIVLTGGPERVVFLSTALDDLRAAVKGAALTE